MKLNKGKLKEWTLKMKEWNQTKNKWIMKSYLLRENSIA